MIGQISMSIAGKHTDLELLQRCANNDSKAQFLLHKRHYGLLLVIGMRYTKSREDAEEVISEAFYKIFQNASNYKGKGTVVSWMSRITINTALDQVRKTNKYRSVFFPGKIPDRPIKNTALTNLGTERLIELIQKLPSASRTVFSLYVIEGYPHKEIARLLEISVGTSKWHLNNARKILQKAISKKGLNS